MRNWVYAAAACLFVLTSGTNARAGAPLTGDGPKLIGASCAAGETCPAFFACEAVEIECASDATCDCPPCPAGVACPACECPEEGGEACTPTTEQRCVFRPQSCANGESCVDGFSCQETESCSGGGCACPGTDCACPPCPPGEACADCACPPPEECVCDEEPTCTTDGAYCLPVETACTEDAQCPTDWSCATSSSTDDCACECACPACPTGDCEPCDCEPCECGEPVGSNSGLCMPAGWEEMGGELGGGSPTNGEAAAPRNDEDPGTPSGQLPADDAADDLPVGDGANDEDGFLGCSATGAPLGLTALFALALLAPRRRRR